MADDPADKPAHPQPEIDLAAVLESYLRRSARQPDELAEEPVFDAFVSAQPHLTAAAEAVIGTHGVDSNDVMEVATWFLVDLVKSTAENAPASPERVMVDAVSTLENSLLLSNLDDQDPTLNIARRMVGRLSMYAPPITTLARAYVVTLMEATHDPAERAHIASASFAEDVATHVAAAIRVEQWLREPIPAAAEAPAASSVH